MILFFNIFSFGAVLMLFAYHLILYIGRKKEYYILLFSLYLLSASLNIFFITNIYTYFSDFKNLVFIKSIVNILYLSSFFLTFPNFFFKTLDIDKNIKILYSCYFFGIIELIKLIVFIFIVFILGYKWYLNNLKIVYISIGSINLISFYISIIILIIKAKLYKKRIIWYFIVGLFHIFFWNILERYASVINNSFLLGFFNENYSLHGFAYFMYSVALSKKLNKEFNDLNILKNELEEKVKSRTEKIIQLQEKEGDFLTSWIHESRTSLQCILDIATYLANSLSGKYRDHAKEILNQIDIYITKTTGIINRRKMEAGKKIFNHDLIVNLHEIVFNRTALYKDYARQKMLDLVYVSDKDIFIKADPKSISLIIDNLITNAIKFSKKYGEIKLEIENNNGLVRLLVHDRGIGVHNEDKNIIFQKWEQGKHNLEQQNGYGYGLYYCNQIIQELGGSIFVKDNKPKGAIFVVELDEYKIKKNDIVIDLNKIHFKINPDCTVRKENNISNESDYNTEKSLILVIEDNDLLRNNIFEKLNKDYNVIVAEDCEKGLEILKSRLPNLIVSDIMIDGIDKMDGKMFFKKVKDNYPHIPFIFLTALDGYDTLNLVEEGAIHYLTKPFNPDLLHAHINSILNLINNTLTNVHNPVVHLESKNILNIISDKNYLYHFSPQELKVIELIMLGYSKDQICTTMKFKTNTLNVIFHRIRNKIIESSHIDSRFAKSSSRDTLEINKKNLHILYGLYSS